MTHSVEQHKVPVVGKVEPGQLVGLVTESQDGLDGDVHNHHALGTEGIRQDLNSVGDEETRPGSGVEEPMEPDEEDDGLVSTGLFVSLVRSEATSPEN